MQHKELSCFLRKKSFSQVFDPTTYLSLVLVMAGIAERIAGLQWEMVDHLRTLLRQHQVDLTKKRQDSKNIF